VVVLTAADGRRTKPPASVYTAIETLLPTAYVPSNVDPSTSADSSPASPPPCQLLQLWAGKNDARAGWTMVHQTA
jgi:hypothetical protein